MAIMIPEDVQTFRTDGERSTYHFLHRVAKPNDDYIVWYSPDLNNQEPDFVIYNKRCGVVILEVKDWALDQIVEANPHKFSVKFGGKVESRTNPLKQATGYMQQLMEVIQKDGRLVSRDPAYYGKPTIPLSCGVVFTNINKHEYNEKGFPQVLTTDKTFFWDDLHPESDFCRDQSGKCFREAFERMFPPLFPFKLSGREMDHLKHLIFPIVRVEIPPRSTKPYPVRCARLKSLDNHQEALARKYDNGHRIFSGPSGCGKTLILANKAAFLLKYNPAIKRVLLVCFNITLVNYLKRLLSGKGLPLGENGVHVTHFYQLCADILGEPVQFENEDADYYDLVVQSTVERLERVGPSFDAVLVDEGQDFSPDMYRVVAKVLNPKTDNLTIALDDNQNLYRHTFAWSNVGIRARGRTHKLSYVYRSTRELSRFAASFFHGIAEDEKENGKGQMELFPEFFDFSGPRPEIERLESVEAICAYVADKVAETVAKDECPYSEVAVLYAKKTPQGDSTLPVPEMIEQYLAQKGIFSNWVSKDYNQKSTYDISTNSVAISTIYSAKGLDFACVFLIGLDTIDEAKMTRDQIKRLTYVGITRARYQLFVPYVEETQVIRKLAALV